MLGLGRPVRPEHSPVPGLDAELDGPNIHAGSPEDFDHLGLKHDAAASTVEILGGALEYLDVPADAAQQITREQSAERPTYDQGPATI